MGGVYFVSVPLAFKREGGNVRIEIRSADKLFIFETPFSSAVADFAALATLVHDWPDAKCEVVELDAIRGH